MTAATLEILTIGREILDGRVMDTNSVWLAEQLKGLGLVPRYGQRVDDELGRVIDAFRVAASRSQIVLVTGGLGPTADDLTTEAFARFLGENLVLNEEALAQVQARFRKLGREMIEQQRKQAYFPPSCEILENPEGTAPGFACHLKSGQSWYFMPGVPKEMRAMFKSAILPRLPKVEGYRSSHWATQFTSEGSLQSQLASVHEALPEGFEITYRTRFPENHIGLHGVCTNEAQRSAYDRLAREIGRILGETVFSGGLDQEIQPLEKVVLQKLIAHGRSIGTVESCTGGLLASRITDIEGSSASFWASWICYDNRAKEALGVDPAELRAHGAVSPQVARSLAEAGLAQLLRMGASAPICVSTTGIAGPGGGSEEKPVGLCYIGVASKGAQTQVHEVRGRALLQRTEYKQLFAQKALDAVRIALGR